LSGQTGSTAKNVTSLSKSPYYKI